MHWLSFVLVVLDSAMVLLYYSPLTQELGISHPSVLFPRHTANYFLVSSFCFVFPLITDSLSLVTALLQTLLWFSTTFAAAASLYMGSTLLYGADVWRSTTHTCHRSCQQIGSTVSPPHYSMRDQMNPRTVWPSIAGLLV